jgi:hypothetical protein
MGRARVLVGVVPLSIVCSIGCSIPTGGGGHRGPQCSSTTFLADNFSLDSLTNWADLFGTPAVTTAVGDPAPSLLLRNAAVQSIASFQSQCGLTMSATVRVDSGYALLKVVIPTVARIAMVKAFDTMVVYVICTTSGCANMTAPVAADDAWHQYRFTIDPTGTSGMWLRDGTVQLTQANPIGSTTIQLNLGGFPVDSTTTGPSLVYFDNVLAASP